jgi:hypothetical protein
VTFERSVFLFLRSIMGYTSCMKQQIIYLFWFLATWYSRSKLNASKGCGSISTIYKSYIRVNTIYIEKRKTRKIYSAQAFTEENRFGYYHHDISNRAEWSFHRTPSVYIYYIYIYIYILYHILIIFAFAMPIIKKINVMDSHLDSDSFNK